MQSAGRYIIHSRTIKNVYHGGKHHHLLSSLHIVQKRLDHDAIFAIFRISASSPNNWPFPRAPAKISHFCPPVRPCYHHTHPYPIIPFVAEGDPNCFLYRLCDLRFLHCSDCFRQFGSNLLDIFLHHPGDYRIYSSGLRKHLQNHPTIIKCRKDLHNSIHNSIHFNFTIHKYNLVHTYIYMYRYTCIF